jgi:hypothetical protein
MVGGMVGRGLGQLHSMKWIEGGRCDYQKRDTKRQ